jgi:hypothetical protein
MPNDTSQHPDCFMASAIVSVKVSVRLLHIHRIPGQSFLISSHNSNTSFSFTVKVSEKNIKSFMPVVSLTFLISPTMLRGERKRQKFFEYRPELQ